jgi:hypothetical protein
MMELTNSPQDWDDCVKNNNGHTEDDFEFLGGASGFFPSDQGRAYRCKAHKVFYLMNDDGTVQTSTRPGVKYK